MINKKKSEEQFWFTRVFKKLMKIWKSDDRLIHPISLKERKEDRNYIGMVNIYFDKPGIIEGFIVETQQFLVKELVTLNDNKNEIILRNVSSGYVIDQGRRDFSVLGGFVIEAYGFESESMLFIRVSHEKEEFGEKKEWISLDVDENLPSLWFSD
ncbi:MAG: hypothetical protein ACTSUV_03740 [Candidatus Ranarchaeia archaeon]